MNSTTLKTAVEAACMQEYSLPPTHSKHFFSLAHKRSMKQILSLCDNCGCAKRRFTFRTVKLAAIAIILAVVVVFGAGSTSKKEGFIVQHTPVSNIYRAASAEGASETFEDYYTITYVPEGFTFESDRSYIDDATNDRCYRAEYSEKLGRKPEFYFSQIVKDTYKIYIDNERSIHQNVTVNGHPGIYVDFPYDAEMPWGVLMWDNGDYILIVDGDLDKNEMLEIAKSAKIQNS